MWRAVEMAQAREAEIQADLARVRRELRNTRQRQARQLQLPAAMWRVATVIFALTHPNVEPAATFLEQRWQHWDAEQDRMKMRLRGWHAQLLLTGTAETVLQPTSKTGQTAMAKAKRFLQELELHTWVNDANTTQGIAPMSSIVLDRAVRDTSTANSAPLLRVTAPHKSKLQWLRRWRRRWQVGLGALQARDTLPPAECATKVREE